MIFNIVGFLVSQVLGLFLGLFIISYVVQKFNKVVDETCKNL